jgi:hypothetical protein
VNQKFVTLFSFLFEEHVAQKRALLLASLSSGSFWETQRENARYFLTAMLLQVNRLLWMMEILGRFLLGLLAGRHLLMQEVERNRPWHRRLLGWGLVLGVLGNGAGGGGAAPAHRGAGGPGQGRLDGDHVCHPGAGLSGDGRGVRGAR